MPERHDHMCYLPDMDVIDSDMLTKVLTAVNDYDYFGYTAVDVEKALEARALTPADFAALLAPAARPYLEQIAAKAQQSKARHFGNSVYLFTPLYLANHCENHCVYCGFNCKSQIRRARLDLPEIERELQSIAASGLEEILLLTGESPSMSPVDYIGEACALARNYFRVVGVEVYPLNVADYTYLRRCGVDFVTVFQETYDPAKYARLHPAGRKRIFPYRFYAQERALMGGVRGVAFAVLLGLADFRKDAFATGMHAYLMQKKYPQAEIAFSCPRLRPIAGNSALRAKDVGAPELLQVIMAYRLFMPFANITISSRENALFRDNAVKIAATKISAGVDVGIGGHAAATKGDEQFEIDDGRSVSEIYGMLEQNGLQPVLSDYLYV